MRRLIRKVSKRLRGRPTKHDIGVEFYDDAFSSLEEYRKPYWNSGYYFTWTVICDRIRRRGVSTVLEVGCGPGQLAEYLVEQGVESYVGLDYSRVAIEMCREKNLPRSRFEEADATSTDIYTTVPHDIIICTEVLEHIERDLETVGRFGAGKYCLLTVPSFPYTSHVRHFSSEAEVSERYAEYFDDYDVWGIRRPGEDTSWYFLMEGIRRSAR